MFLWKSFIIESLEEEIVCDPFIFEMRIIFALLLFFVITSCGYKKAPKNISIDKRFINHVKNYLSKSYTEGAHYQFDVAQKDSLRASFFFSDSLIYAVMFGYSGKYNDSIHSLHADFGIGFYQYSSSDSAKRVVDEIIKGNEHNLKEGFYGVLGKDYQVVMQVSNFVLHLGGNCKSTVEKEWIRLEDSLAIVVNKFFRYSPYVESKPCE